MARHHARVGHHRVAIDALREIVPVIAARYGSSDPRTLIAKTILAQAVLDSGVADAEVRQLLDEATAGWNAKDDPDAVQPCYTRLATAQWLAMTGDVVAANAKLESLERADSRADRFTRLAAARLRQGR
jgi:hypothetical protein